MSTRGASRTAWITVVLALVPVLVALHVGRRQLSGDALLYGYDHAQLQYPRYAILASALQEEGRFPLWQRPLNAGGPFHANPETPTLYPPVLALSLFLPPLLVMNLTIVAHLALAGLGAFLLVRRLWRRLGGDEPEAAVGGLVAGLVFGACHYTRLEHFNLVAYGAAHALIPWMLLALDALLHGRAPRRAAGLLALLVASQVFTGGLYVYAYTALGLLLWTLADALPCRHARRRALAWGAVAALAAGLLVTAKLAAFPEWAASSNRGVPLAAETLRGVTLGGHGSFDWKTVWLGVLLATGGWPLLLVAGSLPLLRWPAVRAAWLVALAGFGVALGGTAHEALAALPPFDRIRNAGRAWVLVNAALPVLAGLGAAWALARLGGAPRPSRGAAAAGPGGSAAAGIGATAGPSGAAAGGLSGRRLATIAAGVCAALALLPALLDSKRHTRLLSEPLSMRDVVRWRYENWRDVAAQGGDQRAMQVDIRWPGSRNEQFIATALGLEIIGGLVGNAWPAALARHAYDGAGWNLERRRRLGVLAVKWLVTSGLDGPPQEAWDPFGSAAFPVGIDGRVVQVNPWARPRAMEPTAVVGVVGDDGGEVSYALLDSPGFPVLSASVVAFPRDEPPSAAEAAALDALIVVEGGPPLDDGLERSLASSSARRVSLPLGGAGQRALDEVLARIAERVAAIGEGRALPVERADAEHLAVTRLADPRRVADPRGGVAAGGWVVLAETFALHGGWEARGSAGEIGLRAAEAIGAPAGPTAVAEPGERLAVRRADGVATAVLLPAGASELRLAYAPRAVRVGWWLGGAGLGLCLALVLLPAKRGRGPGGAARAERGRDRLGTGAAAWPSA